MRTWGRPSGSNQWVEVSTDANGYDDYVWITTLSQCLKMEYGESPFFGNYGIPAHLTVVTQVQPDYYVQQTQQQFAPYFAALNIVKIPRPATLPLNRPYPPTYQVNVVTHAGAAIQFTTGGIPQ